LATDIVFFSETEKVGSYKQGKRVLQRQQAVRVIARPVIAIRGQGKCQEQTHFISAGYCRMTCGGATVTLAALRPPRRNTAFHAEIAPDKQ
jgi:hypothetical protein